MSLMRAGVMSEILDTPSNLFAAEWPLAELSLGGKNRFDGNNRADDAAVVINRPHPLRRDVAFSSAVNHLKNLLNDGEILPGKDETRPRCSPWPHHPRE